MFYFIKFCVSTFKKKRHRQVGYRKKYIKIWIFLPRHVLKPISDIALKKKTNAKLLGKDDEICRN